MTPIESKYLILFNGLCQKHQSIVLDLMEGLSKTTKPTIPTSGSRFSANFEDVLQKEPFSRFSNLRPTEDRIQQFLTRLWKEDKPLKADLKDIAASIGLSYSRVRTLCKSQTKQSVGKIATKFAIEKCKDQLLNSTDKIFSIGLDVGFEDQAHFSKVFKQQTKLSPREYRLHHRNCSVVTAKQSLKTKQAKQKRV
jgi:AraC-like DNA-binding protein